MSGLIPRTYSEPAFWLLALLVLACTDPGRPPSFDLCVFKWLGFTCPGCGMGHAIAHLLNLDFLAAVETHPLSPFVLVGIAGRILRAMPRPNTATATN